MKQIYYFFSSITFLQLYISIIIECNKKNYKNICIIRKNSKKYSDPLNQNNFKILNEYSKMYHFDIQYQENIDFDKLNGIIFMVDGDIYGPPRKEIIDESMLFLIKNNKNIKKISLTEHMNFWDVYHNFIDYVDYCFFSNKNIIEQLKNFKNNIQINKHTPLVNTIKSYDSNKNIFIGNTKYDNIPSKDEIYQKFHLNKNQKYILFLFPKIRNNFNNNHLLQIYSYLHKLNFKIIVKKRPKDNDIIQELHGDLLVNSDIYPNESLELMKICELCIISSSSANEETVMSEIPCLDLISDLRDYERNEYLLDDKVYKKIDLNTWKNISFHEFKVLIESFEKKNCDYFKKIKNKYIFNHTNSAKKYLEFLNL